MTSVAATIAAVAALVAAMFVWTATPVLAACSPRVVRTAHATWSLSRDAASCELSANPERIGDQFEVVVPDAPGFVAIGRAAQDPATGAPREWAAFTSPDGAAWTRHPLPFAAAQLERGVDMASKNGLVVLVGAGFAGRSPDGITWQIAATPPPALARVTAVTATGTGWLAIGQTTRTSAHAAMWTSRDGLTWTPVRDQAAFRRFCAFAPAWRTGRSVVVGSDCNGRPAAVSSTNGIIWRRAPGQVAFGRQGSAHDVVTTATGFVAAGDDHSSTGARGTAFWTSSDGIAWRRVAFFSAPRGGETFAALVRTPSGYFGLADIGSITDGLPPAAFFSATGTTWRRDGLLPNYGYGSEDGDWLTDATAVGNTIVATGAFNDPDPGSYLAGGLITMGTAHR